MTNETLSERFAALFSEYEAENMGALGHLNCLKIGLTAIIHTDDILAALRAAESPSTAEAAEAPRWPLDNDSVAIGDPVVQTTSRGVIKGHLAGVVKWAGVESPVIAFLANGGAVRLHFVGWSQLDRARKEG